MRLTRLQLKNFRNFSNISISLDADLVLVLGENAAGKTNLLESLYYLSNLRSFRAPDQILAQTGTDYFAIQAQSQNSQFEIVVELQPRLRRVLKLNGVKVRPALWQAFAVVLFVPSDLNLFSLGPGVRRRYLNETLRQHHPAYALDLASLEHVLKQKTSLLKEIAERRAEPAQLEFWNQQLSELSFRLTRARGEFINFLQQGFEEIYEKLTGFKSKFVWEYKSQTVEAASLQAYQEAEIRAGVCLLGPHRDDFLIQKDGRLNLYHSSRGELRVQCLAMKLLQAEYLSLKQKPGTSIAVPGKPVILLDDVFSELDEERRSKLLHNLQGYQIVISSTEEHHLPNLADSDAKILKVHQGQISD